MRRHVSRLFPAWLLLVSAACASSTASQTVPAAPARKRPAWLVDPSRSPPPECPPERFMAAVGESADSADEAVARARKALSEAISVEIRSSVERRTTERATNGQATVDVVNKVELEQRSAFKRAELMEPVGAPFQDGPTHVRLVCMEKARAADAVARDMATPLATFRVRQEAALKAAKDNDRAGFSSSFQEASREAQACIAGMAMLDALQGGQAPESITFWNQLGDLTRAAATMRAQTSFTVAVDAPGIPVDEAQRLASEVAGTIRENGFAVGQSNACGSSTYLLTLSIKKEEASCRYGGLGWNCSPQVALEAKDCKTGRTAFNVPWNGALRGSHVKDEERALRKALANAGGPALKSWVKAALASELPVTGGS